MPTDDVRAHYLQVERDLRTAIGDSDPAVGRLVADRKVACDDRHRPVRRFDVDRQPAFRLFLEQRGVRIADQYLPPSRILELIGAIPAEV